MNVCTDLDFAYKSIHVSGFSSLLPLTTPTKFVWEKQWRNLKTWLIYCRHSIMLLTLKQVLKILQKYVQKSIGEIVRLFQSMIQRDRLSEFSKLSSSLRDAGEICLTITLAFSRVLYTIDHLTLQTFSGWILKHRSFNGLRWKLPEIKIEKKNVH